MTQNASTDLDVVEFVSMGNYFTQAEYETAYFGKWHLVFDENDVAPRPFPASNARDPNRDKGGHAK